MAQARVGGKSFRGDSNCAREHLLEHVFIDCEIGWGVVGCFAPEQRPLIGLVLDRGLVGQGNALVGNVLGNNIGGDNATVDRSSSEHWSC